MMLHNDDTAISRFWDKYISILHTNKIDSPIDRWYVIRLEEYIRFYQQKEPHIRLHNHTWQYIETFIELAHQNKSLESWQIQQLVHALQLLFVYLLKLPWAQECDWDYWKASFNDASSNTSEFDRQPQPLEKEQSKFQRYTDTVKQHSSIFKKLVAVIRQRDYSLSTEKLYSQWIARYIMFNRGKEPQLLNETHIVAFLEYLAVKRNVSPATQNQALCALVFLYHQVMGRELGRFEHFARAKKVPRLPVVLTREEVRNTLDKMQGVHHLMASLLYGTGMRLMECLRLRVKDIDYN